MKYAKRLIAVLLVLLLIFFLLFLLVLRKNQTEIAWDQSVAQTYFLPAETEASSDAEETVGFAEVLSSQESNTSDTTWRVDLEGLRAINGDAIGWIWQPDTEISYPVVQGINNAYYLTHRFDKSESKEGAIFADAACDLQGNSLILYGHNTSSGKFDSLVNYLNSGADYLTAHPYFVYYSETNPEGVIYDIFSVFKADVSTSQKIQKVYRMPNDEDYPEYLSYLSDCSILDTGITPSADRQMILLSTCSYSKNKRCIVCGIARTASEGGSITNDSNGLSG